MKIEKIDPLEYSGVFGKDDIIYNSAEFNLLNRLKCERIECLLIHDDKRKIGIIGGVIDNKLQSPFSAPFSCFSSTDRNMRIEHIAEALSLLDAYLVSNKFTSLSFVLPPFFYDESWISRIALCLDKSGYKSAFLVNHHLLTSDIRNYEEGSIDKDIRYSLKTAEKYGLVFKRAENKDEMELAYKVIEINKKSKNRPQSMTFDQLDEMRELISIDFLLVFREGDPLASAIVYNHPADIAQVIYWGAVPDSSRYYPMNFLVYQMLRFYYGKGIHIIDLGTSMLGNDLNTGLIKFKDSIGATTSVKLSFQRNLILD
ncbi:MAG: hypothetical protein BWX96_02723 [Bacteroidetes bacterium ADurb.Bin145]|jgi:hypothetical protein|nr:MAG: hypothetical protein BWX96_02723 [Bacteroidetes bacterium ADurb.Bin145]